MAKGVNKVILIGHLGRVPELRYTPSNLSVANVALATSETWKDKQTGEKQERTEWHNLVFYGRLAEIAGKYLAKGSKIYIEGSLRTEKWKDKNENERSITKIFVQDLQMLGEPNSNAGSGNTSANTQSSADSSLDEELEDDIPF